MDGALLEGGARVTKEPTGMPIRVEDLPAACGVNEYGVGNCLKNGLVVRRLFDECSAGLHILDQVVPQLSKQNDPKRRDQQGQGCCRPD